MNNSYKYIQLTGSARSTFQRPSTAIQQVQQPLSRCLSGVPWHSGMSPYPYTLCALPKAVRKCYGCGEDLAQKHRTEPNNRDRRLKGRSNQTSQLIFNADFSNTYYHPVFSHLTRKNPLFNGMVHVEWSEYLTMSTQQKAVVDKYDLNIIFKDHRVVL